MELRISQAREYESKEGKKSIIFNVLLDIDEDTKVTIKGFRYINKAIWLPSINLKGKYIQNIHISNNIYRGLHQAVSLEEWGQDIKPVNEAMVGEALDSKTMALGGFTE